MISNKRGNGKGNLSKPAVSVIIPTLNEAKNLPMVLHYIPLDVVDEIILVDGRSKDNTVDIARQLLPSIKVVLETKPGKGAAMRRGYAESTGDILIVLDADGSHDPREIPRYVQALLEGADFVKGSRFAPSGGTTDMPRLRMFGNWGFTKMVNILFAQSFSDLLYGYHAFWRYCLNYIDLEAVDGFEIDASIYLQAVRNKLKVVDVPSFEGSRFYGKSNLSTFGDGWRVLRTVLKEWNNSVRKPVSDPPIGFRNYSMSSVPTEKLIPSTGRIQLDGQEAAQMEVPSERKRYLLGDLIEACRGLTPSGNAEQLLSNVVLDVMEQLGASSGSMLLMGDALETCTCIQVFGRNTELVPVVNMTNILQEGVAGWVIQNQQPVLISNTDADPRWLSQPWELEEKGARSAIVVPFVRNQHVDSILILTRPEDRPFTEKDLDRINSMELFL